MKGGLSGLDAFLPPSKKRGAYTHGTVGNMPLMTATMAQQMQADTEMRVSAAMQTESNSKIVARQLTDQYFRFDIDFETDRLLVTDRKTGYRHLIDRWTFNNHPEVVMQDLLNQRREHILQNSHVYLGGGGGGVAGSATIASATVAFADTVKAGMYKPNTLSKHVKKCQEEQTTLEMLRAESDKMIKDHNL